MTNPYTHFYLYSKGWYQRNDLMSDLRVIAGEMYSIYPQYVQNADVTRALLEVVFQDVLSLHDNDSARFSNFVYDLVPTRRWRYCSHKTGDDMEAVICARCISALAQVKVAGICLGEPDSSILPLSNWRTS